MKYIGFVSIIGILYTLNANADNFVWQYYDNSFYHEADPAESAAGTLTGISDIYYTYTFDTKTMLMTQTEWLADGSGSYEGEYEAPYDSKFIYTIYLNNPNLDTELFLFEKVNDFLSAYREQALADVNIMINDIVNQTSTNNISEYELHNIAEMTTQDIFNGADITSLDIYKRLQKNITTISKRDGNISAIATAIGNTPTITNAELSAIKLKLDYYLHNNASEYSRLLDNMIPNTATLSINTTRNVLSAINNQVFNRINNIQELSRDEESNQGDMWIQGVTNYSKKNGNSEFNSNTFGITTGIDKLFNNNMIIGIGYHYNSTKAVGADRVTDVTGHTFFTYGEYRPFNNWYLSALLSSGVFSYVDNTNVVKSEYLTSNFGVNLITGYDWDTGFGVLSGAKYFNVNQNKYTDSVGQYIYSKNSSVLIAVIGCKYNSKNSFIFTPNIHINAMYDILHPDNYINVDIAGVPYQIKGENINPFGIEIGVAFNLYENNWGFDIGYDLEYHSDLISHTGRLRAKCSF